MFTGIVADIGQVSAIDQQPEGALSLTIACSLPRQRLAAGDSIACSGVCLTIAESGADTSGNWFRVQVSEETRRATTLAAWRPRQRVNLEPAVLAATPLGGHLMAGHVDAASAILSMQEVAGCRRVWLDAPAGLARYIAPKCSIGLDGVSLTVNEIRPGEVFAYRVEIIPHTLAATCWGEARPGDRLNMEIDMLARYVERLLQHRGERR